MKIACNVQLNFAKFRKQLKGLRKTTTNVQVVGFTDADAHKDVLAKGAKGLGIECGTEILLVCSNGIVLDMPILGKQWTLGEFIQQNGGVLQIEVRKYGECFVPMMRKEHQEHQTQ